MCWDPRRAKPPAYTKRSKSKAMESKIETLELQNQDLKGKILSHTKVAVTTMANHNIIGHAQACNTVSPPPHVVRDPSYGMPYGWNVETPANEEQEQPKTGGQHQASWTTPSLVVHKKTPPAEDKWQPLEERLHVIEGGNRFELKAMDLYLVPDVDLLADFKTWEFNKYKGSSYLRVHMAMYYRKMAAYIYDDKILIHCFQDSLTGAALNWYVSLEQGRVKIWRDLVEAFLKQYKYNKDMVPDRSRLQNMVKREQEGFKEYAQRWHELAAVTSNFIDLVVVSKRIELGIRHGKLTQANNDVGSAKKLALEKRKGEANAVLIEPIFSQGKGTTPSYPTQFHGGAGSTASHVGSPLMPYVPPY
ncbi:hypothetical protein CR513_03166, partial [Mucuna pruriens]